MKDGSFNAKNIRVIIGASLMHTSGWRKRNHVFCKPMSWATEWPAVVGLLCLFAWITAGVFLVKSMSLPWPSSPLARAIYVTTLLAACLLSGWIAWIARKKIWQFLSDVGWKLSVYRSYWSDKRWALREITAAIVAGEILNPKVGAYVGPTVLKGSCEQQLMQLRRPFHTKLRQLAGYILLLEEVSENSYARIFCEAHTKNREHLQKLVQAGVEVGLVDGACDTLLGTFFADPIFLTDDLAGFGFSGIPLDLQRSPESS
jgi:hypothetical protein